MIEVGEFNQTGIFLPKRIFSRKRTVALGDSYVLIATSFPFYYDDFDTEAS